MNRTSQSKTWSMAPISWFLGLTPTYMYMYMYISCKLCTVWPGVFAWRMQTYIFLFLQHIVVVCGGNFYMLPVTNSRGKFISVLDLESQFEWITADAKHSDGEKCLPSEYHHHHHLFATPQIIIKKNYNNYKRQRGDIKKITRLIAEATSVVNIINIVNFKFCGCGVTNLPCFGLSI